MAEYGFKCSQNVNGSLNNVTVDASTPSLLWTGIVSSSVPQSIHVPALSNAKNVVVTSTPLNYNTSKTKPDGYSVGSGGTNLNVDYGRYYTAPNVVNAIVDTQKATIEMNASTVTLDALIQQKKSNGIFVANGTRIDKTVVDMFPDIYIISGTIEFVGGVYISNNLIVSFSKLCILKTTNIAYLWKALGVLTSTNIILFYYAYGYPVSASFAEGLRETVNNSAINTGAYLFKNKYLCGYLDYDHIRTYTTGVSWARHSYYMDRLDLMTTESAVLAGTFNYLSTAVKYKNYNWSTAVSKAFWVNRKPTNVRRSSTYDYIGITVAGAVRIEYGHSRVGKTKFITSGKSILEYVDSIYNGLPLFHINNAEHPVYISPDSLSNTPNCVINVYGELSADDLAVVGHGLTNVDGTINQEYKNLFLYEQQEVTISSTTPLSQLGIPARTGRKSVYWDNPSTGGTTNKVLYDSLDIPLNTFVASNTAVECYIDINTTTPVTFLGFFGTSSAITHARFLCPALKQGDKIRFSVVGPCKQTPIKYKSYVGTATSTHAQKHDSYGDSYGRIYGGSVNLLTVKMSMRASYAIADADAYGAIVKNKSGYSVFDSTQVPVQSVKKEVLSDVGLGIHGGGNIGRSINTPITGDLPKTNKYGDLCVLGGTFNAVDYALYDSGWTKTKDVSFLETKTYGSYLQCVLGSIPCVGFVSSTDNTHVRIRLSYAPVWNWYVKKGETSYGFTTLGTITARVATMLIAAVSIATGQIQGLFAAQQVWEAISFKLSKKTPGYEIIGNNYSYDENGANVVTVYVPDILD